MKPPTLTYIRRVVGRGHDGYGYRPVNNWGGGDLPAPYSVGDLLWLDEKRLSEDGDLRERLRALDHPGWFVICYATSIDEGDAWYFRVDCLDPSHDHGMRSDRLHVALNGAWDEPCDFMAAFQVMAVADPDGLKERQRMLADGWVHKRPKVCDACGHRMYAEDEE